MSDLPPDPLADFVLHLKALPDTVAPAIRVRQLLKYALRAQRLRCVGIRPPPDTPAAATAGGASEPAGGEAPERPARARRRY